MLNVWSTHLTWSVHRNLLRCFCSVRNTFLLMESKAFLQWRDYRCVYVRGEHGYCSVFVAVESRAGFLSLRRLYNTGCIREIEKVAGCVVTATRHAVSLHTTTQHRHTYTHDVKFSSHSPTYLALVHAFSDWTKLTHDVWDSCGQCNTFVMYLV